MKTLFSFLIIIGLYFSTSAQNADDKIFKQGDHVCEAGSGLALFTHSKITWKTPDTTYNESTGSVIFPVRYQYGVNDWLGLGGMFRFHNFIEDDNNASQAVGFDLGIRADFHYLRTRRLDFSGALGFGFSRMSWKGNDLSNQHFYGSGFHFDAELLCRFYFSDHFGIHFAYGRILQNLPNMILEDDYGNRDELKFVLSGGQFSVGLQVKF